MADGLSSAYGNSADHTPDDVRWHDERSDPARNWAITRAQPVASLAVSGALWGFSRTVAPPAQLIGRRLIITAGGSHHPFKEAGESGKAALLEYCGVSVSPAEIPAGRQRLFRDAVKTLQTSVSVGAVRLAAAFRIGHVIDGKVYADLKAQATGYPIHTPRGTWREFDRREIAEVEALTRGRWMWCFDAAHEFDLDLRVSVKGFGGVWDYEKGLKHRGAL